MPSRQHHSALSDQHNPEVYRALHTGTLGDSAFYLDLARHSLIARKARGEPLWVLELGCGAGRLSLPIWELGAHLIGVDMHDGLLELARDELKSKLKALTPSESAKAAQRIQLEQRDFTSLTPMSFSRGPAQGFDLILLPYNGLYCLETEDAQVECLKTAGSLLAPHGSLWVDGYALPDPDEYDYESDEDFSPLTVLELPQVHQVAPRELGVEERDVFDLAQQRLDVHYRYLAAPDRAETEPLHAREEVVRHRYVYPWDLPDLSARAGLSITTLYADFDEELDPREALREMPWGVDLTHWTARLSPLGLSNKTSI